MENRVSTSTTCRAGYGKVTFLAAVIEKELRPKRNGGSFLSVRLADRSGGINAEDLDNPEIVAQLFDCNDVVKVRGAMEHYNDKPQLIVSRIRRCEPQEYTASDFYPASIRDPEEMFGELESFVAMVRDEPLRQLLESIIPDVSISARLKTAPAAMKIHHAFRGGLLEHVLSLCNLAVALTAHYPRLNFDRLMLEPFFTTLGRSKRSVPRYSFRLHHARPTDRARHARPGDPRQACRTLGRVSAGAQDHPSALRRQPSRRPGQRRAAATDAAGVLCAFSPGSDGRADGTGVQANRLGAGRRRVHIVCPVARTAVVRGFGEHPATGQ